MIRKQALALLAGGLVAVPFVGCQSATNITRGVITAPERLVRSVTSGSITRVPGNVIRNVTSDAGSRLPEATDEPSSRATEVLEMRETARSSATVATLPGCVGDRRD